MSFCNFCDPSARKLKMKISQLEAEVGRMVITNEYLMQLQRIQNTKKQGIPIFDQIFNRVPKNKKKLIQIIKEALMARNMTEGEANNTIQLLLKIKS